MPGEDDTFDDVRAAFAEVAARETTETPAERVVETPTPNDGGDELDKSEVSAVDTKPARGPAKDERGRFVKRDAAKAAEKPVQSREAEELTEDEEGDDQSLQDGKSTEAASKQAGGPPPSWSVKAKAAWDQLPAEVRADIAKRETEVAQGLAALKDYKDLKPYAEMAAKHNTTISAALKHYTGIENVLRQDIGQGLSIIAQNYGLNQQQAAQLFAGLAQKYGAQAGTTVVPTAVPGNPGAQPQPGDPLYDILKPFIEPLKQEITTLRQTHTSREAADRNAAQQSLAKALETFSARPENRYFPDLEETITKLFQTGMVPLTGNHEGDLRTAYDMAAQMVPDVREALIEQRLREQKDAERRKEQEAAQKAKNASRSLTGSRVPGTVVRPEPHANGHDDVEADVRSAYRLLAQH